MVGMSEFKVSQPEDATHSTQSFNVGLGALSGPSFPHMLCLTLYGHGCTEGYHKFKTPLSWAVVGI
jgi:hypothetical protein